MCYTKCSLSQLVILLAALILENSPWSKRDWGVITDHTGTSCRWSMAKTRPSKTKPHHRTYRDGVMISHHCLTFAPRPSVTHFIPGPGIETQCCFAVWNVSAASSIQMCPVTWVAVECTVKFTGVFAIFGQMLCAKSDALSSFMSFSFSSVEKNCVKHAFMPYVQVLI